MLNTIWVVISNWYTCPSWRKLARAIGVSKIFINLKEKRTALEEVTISMLLFSYFSFTVFIQNRTPQISNFCNVVIGMKFGSDFNFGQSQIFKMVFCFWVVGLYGLIMVCLVVLNIINGNFGLVKSWQKSPRPIRASVLFVLFWSHSKPHTKAQLGMPKRLSQFGN